MRQQEVAYDDAADQVSDDQLQESEVGVVGESGHADDGECAGFGGDDGECNSPPWDVAVGEKVVAQRTLLLPKAQSEKRDAREIGCDDREVEEGHKVRG